MSETKTIFLPSKECGMSGLARVTSFTSMRYDSIKKEYAKARN